MIKNKRVVIIILIVLLTILNIFLVLKKDSNVVEKSEVIKVERKEFNIYKEQTTGSGNYQSTSDTTFPTSGYLLNTTKTMCYDYNGKETTYKPIQNLVNGVIDGSVTLESSKTTYCDLYFTKDETPTISKFDVTGKTSGGTTLSNSFTYQTDNLPFNVIYADNENDVKQYCINETNSTTNCNWQTLSGTSGTYTLTNKNDGTKTMYIFLKDKANNISASSNKSITVDKTAPVVTSFTLTGTNETGQTLSNASTYTHTKKITYNASITETNIESYCVYEGSSCSYINTTEKELTKKEYNLTENEGIKTLSIKVKDKAGNESVVDTNSTKKITLDKTNPIATISSKSVTTNSITVTVGNETDISGIVQRQCKIDNQNNWKDAELNGDCTIDSLDNKTELKDGTEYTIQARVKDGSGRWSTNNPSVNVTTESARFSPTELLTDTKRPKGLSDSILGESPKDSSTYNNDMYRFVGACNAGDNNGTGCGGIVDNFVCFGYSDSKNDCVKELDGGVDLDNDYIYRIIGITRDGKLKLIKNTAIREGTGNYFVWSNSENVEWPNSDIFKRLNGQGSGSAQGSNGNTNIFIDSETSNVRYLKTGNDWYSKIDSTHKWFYGGIFGSNLSKTADELYNIESGNQAVPQNYNEGTTLWTSKIQATVGLMYVSDYYYSYATDGSDSSKTNCYNNKFCKNSWMHISNNGKSADFQYEWTMTRYGRNSYGYYFAWSVRSGGDVSDSRLHADNSVRPVFFLQSNVNIVGGDGTVGSPFIIEGT